VAAAAAVWWNDPMDAGNLAPDKIGETTQRGPATGPLRTHSANPRYFTDESGRAVYLTGSHTWNNFQDTSHPAQDYTGYLRLLREKNHNFVRLWVWEQGAWAPWTKEKIEFSPLPYRRPGPGIALDGRPRFDLTQFNQAYFDRLRSRVAAARDYGVYVSVMLFQGWSVGKKPNEPGNPWRGHPFHRKNNVNGIHEDLNGDDEGKEVHTLEVPAVTALQERYVRKVVDTLNDLDNVLWEISNEADRDSKEWQYYMIRFIKDYEADKPKQHPVGMTACLPGGRKSDLFESPADWISPAGSNDDRENPPAADGSKIIITDTDHLWGVGGDRGWVWKSFARGLNPIYMDPFEHEQWKSSGAKFESCRQAMGHTLAYANRMNLTTAVPHGNLASSGYCLADPGEDYLVYVPFEALRIESARVFWRFAGVIRNFRWRFKQTIRVNLSSASGIFLVEWFNPSTGETTNGAPVDGGSEYSFTAPFHGDSVLCIRKRAINQGE
jgi:hypothetical protein